MQTIIVTLIVAAAVIAAVRHTISTLKNRTNTCSGCPKCSEKKGNMACNSKK